MISGLYSAATALDNAIANQDAVAENLAHANVPGYRRRGLIFGTFEQQLQEATAQLATPVPPFQPRTVEAAAESPAAQSLFGAQPLLGFTGFEPGQLQHTGNPLDVAATGSTFFVVEGPSGTLYTRNGTFRLNEQNQLETTGGLRVRGQGGSITLPPDASRIAITPDGRVLADNVEIDRLTLANFDDPRVLQRAGTSVFQGPASPPEPEPGTARIEQGYRESSNVQVVNEMVAMLAGLRHYEAADRALRSISEAVALTTRPQ
jgi:flagellar basal body rod protein FlgG